MSAPRELDAITAERDRAVAECAALRAAWGAAHTHITAAVEEIEAASKHIEGGGPQAATAALARARTSLDKVRGSVQERERLWRRNVEDLANFQPPQQKKRSARTTAGETGPDAPRTRPPRDDGPGY